MRPIRLLSAAVKTWLMVTIPVIVQAGHHPGDRAVGPANGGATLWIFLGIIVLVAIMALVNRKRRK